MFAIIGTIPDDDFPLVDGPVSLAGSCLNIDGHLVDINRGTPALIAAALMVCNYFDGPSPVAYLSGDTGKGAGSRKLYEFLVETLPHQNNTSLTFHYIQPDVDWHNKVLFAIEEMNPRPLLIADAGYMYVAKMSGQAGEYNIFTPDIGELAFLADESAPHPFYTRGFLFHETHRVPELIARSYLHDNAAQYLLVKGEKDFIANKEGIKKIVDSPVVPALEAIGGTGDIITGLLAALTGLGLGSQSACQVASKISRIAGQLADPDPGTQVMEIIKEIPKALNMFYSRKGKHDLQEMLIN